jgi:hypothetical protein
MHAEPHETNAFRDSELPELAPISTSERINTLDMLRGFALIGILMMNIEWFNRAISEGLTLDYSLTGADWVASWSVKLFVEGKFYKLFAVDDSLDLVQIQDGVPIIISIFNFQRFMPV